MPRRPTTSSWTRGLSALWVFVAAYALACGFWWLTADPAAARSRERAAAHCAERCWARGSYLEAFDPGYNQPCLCRDGWIDH